MMLERFGGKKTTIHIVEFNKNTFKQHKKPYFVGKINFREKEGGDPEPKN